MLEPTRHEDPGLLPDDEFRARLRAWLAGYFPTEFRTDLRRPFRRLRGADAVRWNRLMLEHGWRAPAWPREYGGMGLSFRKQLIYAEEFARARVARIIDMGESLLGPVLMQFGTQAQKDRYLPPMLTYEHVWCQGYSEPNAGSDLASLRTQAVRDGDHFVVNGQKIWTTHATDATHIFALVRTGKFPKKQQGISFLLIDMATPGVTVRPINNIAGESEFCEVFFDDVRVPVDELVGTLDEGWNIAKAQLGHERVMNGAPVLINRALELSQVLVDGIGRGTDLGWLDRLAQLTADAHDYRLLYSEICDRTAAGEAPGPEVSVLKIYASELVQRITEFNVELAAEHGAIVGDAVIGDAVVDLHWQVMMVRPISIFAGANEIQRNILAKAVLKMPSEPGS
ncbi:MAG: acyl-CoA dehydrogenase family protein [Gammaproteobacteria bacterium]